MVEEDQVPNVFRGTTTGTQDYHKGEYVVGLMHLIHQAAKLK